MQLHHADSGSSTGLNSQQLTKILNLVKNDPEVLNRLESYLDDVLPDSLGLAGSFRNLGYIFTRKDPSEPHIEAKVCTGISRAVAEVIQKQIKAGNPDFQNFEMANTVDRNMDVFIIGKVAHTATVIKMKNGESFVLDYHHTLNADNPMVFKSVEDWEIEKQSQTAEEFLNDHPILPNDSEFKSPNNAIPSPKTEEIFTKINDLLAEINQKIQIVQSNIHV